MSRGRILFIALSMLWLLYALWLDVRYERFPEVILGAVQILLALCVLVALAWAARVTVARLTTRR